MNGHIIDQLSRIEGQEIAPHKYTADFYFLFFNFFWTEVIFYKGAKVTQWRKDSLLFVCLF